MIATSIYRWLISNDNRWEKRKESKWTKLNGDIKNINKGAKNLESRNKTTKDVCFRMSKDWESLKLK